MLGKGLQLKTTALFSVVSKVFEKLVNNRIVDHRLGLLLIFSQLYLIELLGILTVLGLLELWHLIYPRILTGFGMLVFFTNLSLLDFRLDIWPCFFFSK